MINPLSPHNPSKQYFTSLKTYIFFILLRGLGRKIFMKPFYQHSQILFDLSFISSHLHPIQVENCDSNSPLVVDKENNGKLRVSGCTRHMKRARLGSGAPQNPPLPGLLFPVMILRRNHSCRRSFCISCRGRLKSL